MNTVYYHGIQSSRNTYWMGNGAAPAPKPTVKMGQLEWLPDLAKAGGTAFGQYENAQAAQDAADAAKAKAAAAASQAQTAGITAAAMQAQLNANKILGLDPGMFWGGLALVATATVIGVVVANKK